jgi:alpha-beta hydrolase superfamily lysophospholipase
MRTRTQPPADTPVNQRRRRRWPILALALVVVLAGVFYLGGGWYFSGRLYQQALSGAAKRAARPTYNLSVVAVTPATVTLGVPTDPGQLLTPGVWGLQWPTGYGQVTRIVAHGQATVTRAFRHLTGSPLAAGARVALDNKAFPRDPRVGLGIPFRNVSYRGPLGSYPAWLIPGSTDTWAILVHGNAMDRLDTIKIVPALHRLGLPVLMISYRNDAGAPQDPSGMLRYGLTEWQDLAAAVQYALGHGARQLLLVGYSMGGAIVASFLERSPLGARVAGAILDSPMTDLGRAVDHGASRQTLPLVGLPLPQSLTDVAKWISGWRYGVDWRSLDYLKGAAKLHAPILLFQGTADTKVPSATSDELARIAPDVTYIQVTDADHLDSWNLDPAPYDRAVQAFVGRVLRSSAA